MKNSEIKLEADIAALKKDIQRAYAEGVTILAAEKLASKTLLARMALADAIQVLDLDARMKRQGVKAERGSLYSSIVAESEKKPTETAIESMINTSLTVVAAEQTYAEADTSKDRLHTYSDIFKDAHIFFRSVAKGTFEG